MTTTLTNMPVMDGFDFLEVLRSRPETVDIPVVVLSSMDLTNEERNTLNASADQVLSKSELSLRQLAGRVKAIVPAPPNNDV